MHSIRIRITAVTLLAIIISVLTLGYIAVYTIGVESDANSAEKMQLMCDSEKKSLDAYLNSLKQSVDMADFVAEASLEDLRLDEYGIPNASSRAVDQTPEQAKKLDEFLAAHCALVQSAFGSVADGTQGVETYYYCINSNLGSSEHGFFYSRVGRTSYEEQEPLDSRDLDPQDTDHTGWYYLPIQHGSSIWVGPYRAHYLNEVWAISYVVPTYKDNTLVGVMGMDILLDTMIDRIKALKVYDTGFACLLDQDGHVIYHPSLETGTLPDAIKRMTEEGVFQQDSSDGKLIRYEVDGQQRQLAFSTLENGLKVAIIAPVSEITATTSQLTSTIILAAIVILIAFAVLIMLSMRVFTKPLKELTEASRELAAGDYDIELDYEGKDEVGVLTESFRQMRDQMKAYIDDLNSRATTDALTGIKNKGVFDEYTERLDKLVAAAANGEGEPPQFGIVMFDSNSLKEINDEFGHVRGDEYLRHDSMAICRTYAHSPVFRVGGDEFAVILEGSDYNDRDQLFRQFDQLVEEMNAAAEHPWERVDLAKGMATFVPGKDESVVEVVRRADDSMYEDKRQYKEAQAQALAQAQAQSQA